MKAARTHLKSMQWVGPRIASLLVVFSAVGLMMGCAASRQSKSESRFSQQQELAAGEMNQSHFQDWQEWAQPGWPF